MISLQINYTKVPSFPSIYIQRHYYCTVLALLSYKYLSELSRVIERDTTLYVDFLNLFAILMCTGTFFDN